VPIKFYFLPIAIAAAVALRIVMHFVDKESIEDEVGELGVHWSEPRTSPGPPTRIIARHHCAKCG